jgi:hypothetical protein
MSFVGPKYLADSAVEPQRGLIDAVRRERFTNAAPADDNPSSPSEGSHAVDPVGEDHGAYGVGDNGNVPGRSRRVLGADDQRDDLPASGAMTATS